MRSNPRPVSFICSEIAAAGAVALCAPAAGASTFAATAAPTLSGAVTARETPPCVDSPRAVRPARVAVVSQRGVKVTLWDEITPAERPAPLPAPAPLPGATPRAAAETAALVQPCAPARVKRD